MKTYQADHRVTTMCRVLELSTSGYYAWLRRGPSPHAQKDAELSEKIQTAFAESRGTYGVPRIHAELADDGIQVGRKRIARLMKANGLEGVSRRRRRPQTTVRDEKSRPAPDLVNREFSAERPNQLWVADITYVPTLVGFLYLAVVLDVFSR